MKILLPVGVIVLVVVVFIGGRLILSPKNILTSPDKATNTLTQNNTTPSSSPSGTLEQRIAELEFSVSDLLKQVRGVTPSSQGATISSDTEKRIKTLETSVADLVTRVTALEQKNTTATTTPQTATSKAPSYIPLGWVGSSVSTSWTSITGQEFTINTADYPDYTSMQFEVSLRIFQNGQAFARLEVKDAGTSILASEVSTTSQSYTWLISSSFQLPAGSKTYRLQLKSLTGYSADVQNARIKVNF